MDSSGKLDASENFALRHAVQAGVDQAMARNAVTTALASGLPIELELLDAATDGDPIEDRVAFKEKMLKSGLVTINGRPAAWRRRVTV
jgi:hypothetical protein